MEPNDDVLPAGGAGPAPTGGSDNTGGAAGGGGGDGGAPKPPPSVRLDDSTIQQITSLLASQQQQQPQPQVDPAQLEAMLKVVKLDPSEIAEAIGLDEERAPKALKFFEGYTQRLVEHINTLNNLRLQMLSQQLAPLFEVYTDYQNRKYEQEFFEANEDLKSYADIARMVYRDMLAKGVKFPSKEAAYAAIAENTRKVVKSLGGAAPSGQQMPTILMGGRPSGAPSGQQQTGNPVKELFD